MAGSPIDVEKLKFTQFSERDDGTYVCIRKGYGSRETKKEIKVVLNRKYFFVIIATFDILVKTKGILKIYQNINWVPGQYDPKTRHKETQNKIFHILFK